MENVNHRTVQLGEEQRQAMLLSIAHLAAHLPLRSSPLLLECVDSLGGRQEFERYRKLVSRQYEDLVEMSDIALQRDGSAAMSRHSALSIDALSALELVCGTRPLPERESSAGTALASRKR